MTVLNLFKMLALLLVGLVAMTSASPIATSDGVSIAATPDCPACYTKYNAYCEAHKIGEHQCLALFCNSLECRLCSSRCPDIPGSGSDLAGAASVDAPTDVSASISIDTLVATVKAVLADLSATSVAPATKREATDSCFWVCLQDSCTRQCIGDDAVATYKASGAIVINATELHTNTTISVTANHTQLENREQVENAFLYHCDWTSGACWTEIALEAVAGTETDIGDIPDIPYKACREICNTDESLCGLVCDEDEYKKDPEVQEPVTDAGFRCHWECFFGQCWAVCRPVRTNNGSNDVSATKEAARFKQCRWECFFGQCHACCPPP